MTLKRLLVANRGEIASRILHAASELNIETVAIHAQDDSHSLYVRQADCCRPLSGSGPRAYLNQQEILNIARDSQCDAIHPGYGFLSENAEFALQCQQQELLFVGPTSDTLQIFGNKANARKLAQQHHIPVARGSNGPVDLKQAQSFFNQLEPSQAMVIKAVAGGGGRGMRVIHHASEIASAFKRCQSEAQMAFGQSELYVEQFYPNARHIEVQIVGDGHQHVHLFERDCTLQRRHQKLIEVAPSPILDPDTRSRLIESALTLAKASHYHNLGTFEFLVYGDKANDFIFIEANPRLQVEHTVTEELTGFDLVQLQLQLTAGARLNDLGLPASLQQADTQPPQGFALQLRINAETLDEQGQILPSSGTVQSVQTALGPGTRLDSCLYAGLVLSGHYDSLLAKLICRSSSNEFGAVLKKAQRNLSAIQITGIDTNKVFLQNLLEREELKTFAVHTRFVDQHLNQLLFDNAMPNELFSVSEPIDTPNPLRTHEVPIPENHTGIDSPLQGTIVCIEVMEGETVCAGQTVAVVEAMKMEHLIRAPVSGVVQKLCKHSGETVHPKEFLLVLQNSEGESPVQPDFQKRDPDTIRPDLAELKERESLLTDAARPQATAKRHALGYQTARENIDQLCDTGTFREYGALAIAGQRNRHSLQHLLQHTQADGLVAGTGRVNGDLFSPEKTQCVVLSYDYTVLAGTQGVQNHRKKDRLFELAERKQSPVIFLTEGGGGRPGDTDALSPAWLDCLAFYLFARLAGRVPLIGLANGRCFAGNAALFGCCDITIATESANIGMGGPAMIEGGGLGSYPPEAIGPIQDQRSNGVVDIVVKNEAEGIELCKKLLAFTQGNLPEWQCADQRLLRHVVPENRLRVYDIRQLINTLVDTDSAVELQADHGPGIVTLFARIEGKSVGIIANNPAHLGGALDVIGAQKSSRFMKLCNQYQIPLLFLCDTPGFMVGPDTEKTGLVRQAANLFIEGARLQVPFATVVLRKCYGLGAMAMAGGHLKAPLLTVSWPTGEFGAMGLEGAVKLGYRKELQAIEDPQEREQRFQQMVQQAYEQGKAIHMATYFEFDHVIDPKDTRDWVREALFD